MPERVAADGAVLALDEQAVREAVAVCFLHSFTNEAHERRAGVILAEELPGAAISASSRPGCTRKASQVPCC